MNSVNGGTCNKCGEENIEIVGSNIHKCHMTHKIEWREKFRKRFYVGDDVDVNATPEIMEDFIASEVIEALIEDIDNGIDDGVEVYEFQTTPRPSKLWKEFKQQLRAKWLSK